jgi:hypothetical protein
MPDGEKNSWIQDITLIILGNIKELCLPEIYFQESAITRNLP